MHGYIYSSGGFCGCRDERSDYNATSLSVMDPNKKNWGVEIAEQQADAADSSCECGESGDCDDGGDDDSED
jgi:hypothetical protein